MTWTTPVKPAGYRPGSPAKNFAIVAQVAQPNNLPAWRFASALVPHARRLLATCPGEDFRQRWADDIVNMATANRLFDARDAEEIARMIWALVKTES